VRGFLPISTNPDIAMFLGDDGPNSLCPFVGVWIRGHAWEVVEPAGLAVAAGNAFTKERQS